MIHLTQMRDATGKGVMEFVRDIRLDFAARQLKDGKNVAAVGEKR